MEGHAAVGDRTWNCCKSTHFWVSCLFGVSTLSPLIRTSTKWGKPHLVEVLNAYSNFGRMAADLDQLLALIPGGPPPRSDKPHQKQHRLQSDQIAQFQIDYLLGLTLKELANRYDINRSTVNDHAGRLGLPMRYPLLDTDEVTRAAELFLTGLSHMSIAPLFGVNASTIRNVLLKEGDCPAFS